MARDASVPDCANLHEHGAGICRPARARDAALLLKSWKESPGMLRLRSWMFVPGHSKKMVSKSLSLSVDAIMLDLEDGVVPALKAESRPIVAAALGVRELADGPLRYVRV